MSERPALLPANLLVERPDGLLAAHRCGSGPLLLLLHGWSFDRRMWFRQIDLLATRFTVVALDRRGSGATSCPANLAAELEDIDALTDQLGERRFHLAGMSQGGRVALRYAWTRPERLGSLALLAAPLDGWSGDIDMGDRIPIERYRAMLDMGRRDMLMEEWLGHKLLRTDPGDHVLRDLMIAMVEASRWDEILSDAALSGFDTALSERLEQLTLPILNLIGSDDAGHLKNIARCITRSAPRRECIEISGANHLAALSHGAQCAGELLSFLDRVEHVRT